MTLHPLGSLSCWCKYECLMYALEVPASSLHAQQVMELSRAILCTVLWIRSCFFYSLSKPTWSTEMYFYYSVVFAILRWPPFYFCIFLSGKGPRGCTGGTAGSWALPGFAVCCCLGRLTWKAAFSMAKLPAADLLLPDKLFFFVFSMHFHSCLASSPCQKDSRRQHSVSVIPVARSLFFPGVFVKYMGVLGVSK